MKDERCRTMRSRIRSRERRAGFTIVEIMVVVVIIALLATMILPRLAGRIGRAKQGVATSNLADIEKAIEMFSIDYERYPAKLDELVARPSDIPEEKWNPPTVKSKDLLDPWDRQFIYKYPGDHEGSFDLYSLGADGEVGGMKENEDITNWE